MSLCKDCISGVTHEGTAEGKWETIAGIQCYIGTPTIDYPKDKAVLFLPDAMGIQHINNQLLIDDFARNGFYTVGIDYFRGDPVPVEVMDKLAKFLHEGGEDPKFDIFTWVGKHKDNALPLTESVMAALKEKGISAFGGTGYCFGGRVVFDLAFKNAIAASVASHPSLLESPADLEKYLSNSKAPLLLNTCTVDRAFPPEAQAKADEILGGGKFAPGYKREYFEGCTHGFAVRGDLSNPQIKAGKEGSFKSTVEWFIEHL